MDPYDSRERKMIKLKDLLNEAPKLSKGELSKLRGKKIQNVVQFKNMIGYNVIDLELSDGSTLKIIHPKEVTLGK